MRNMSKKTWKLRVWSYTTEMQKLDVLLKKAKAPHTYDCNFLNSRDECGDQIVVYDSKGCRLWDGICCEGSYGYEQGLIEVMGGPILGYCNDVEGWLTARQVTKMWRCRNAAKNR